MQGYTRVLVTGGAGFIGSHLIDRLLKSDLEVVVLDGLQAGKLENIGGHVGKKGFRFVRGDVRDFDLVKSVVKGVDAVLHLAALVSVQQSLENPTLANDVNVNGTLNLLKASVDSGVKRFVYSSTCAVYGEAKHMPIAEDSCLRPLSPYGVSKLAAESYVRVFGEVYGLESICLRYFNVYGSRQAYGDYSGVITRFMDRIRKNVGLVVFGDGEQTRDFVHVCDVVEANMLALRAERVVGEAFNVGTGVATTINRLARTLLQVTNKDHLRVTHNEPREGEIRHSTADISKARKELHYEPRVLLKEGLKDLVQAA
jgi:UDP-glucose 4-epimerase